MRIAEFCEVAGRDFIYTKGLTKGKEGTSTWIYYLDDELSRRARRGRPDRLSFFRFRFFCTHSGWGQGRKCIAQTFFRNGTALFLYASSC